jgi:chromosome partitioning protein
MTTILSCVNLKGGVGKTAIAVQFARYSASLGFKTLLVDLDPQTNATFSCIDIDQWEEHAKNNGSVADLLGVRRHTSAEGTTRDAKSVIVKGIAKNLDLVPSHLDLFTIDLDMASQTAREKKLKRALSPVLDKYKVVVCDCPPNLTIPTQNALAMSTHYVVPISPDYLSGIGVGLLLNRVNEMSDAMETTLEHVGIVISRVGRPAIHRDQTVNSLRAQFGKLVLNQTISERVKVSESAAQKKSIYAMGDATAAQEFTAVSKELITRMGIK